MNKTGFDTLRPNICSESAMENIASALDSYLELAIETIDWKFYRGYAEEHPELIAACIKVQSMDFNRIAITNVLYDLIETVSSFNNKKFKLDKKARKYGWENHSEQEDYQKAEDGNF